MNSGLTLSIVLLVAVSMLLAAVGVSVYRTRLRPLGLWLLGWSSQLTGATLALVSLEQVGFRPVALLFGSLVAPLMLMGAYRFVEREPPIWIAAIGIVASALRIMAYQAGLDVGTILIAGAVEPALALAGAWRITRPRIGHDLDAVDKLLALGFVLYGGAEMVDALLQLTEASSWLHWASWIALSAPLALGQTRAVLARFQHRASRSEQDAYAHQQRLRILTDASELLVVEYDEFGRFTFISSNAEAQVGQPSHEVLGKNALDYLDRVADSPIRQALELRGRIVEDDVRSSRGSPVRVVLADGRIAFYDVDRTSYRTGQDELRILVQARDVTDRIAREESIRDSERRLNRAEEIGNTGSWEVLPKRREMLWSDNHYRLLGLEPRPGTVDHELAESLVEPADLVEMRARLLDAHAGGAIPEMNYRIRRANDGEIRHLRTRSEVERDALGQITRISGASRDVTEQLELEGRLRQGREHLDALIGSNIFGVFFADREDGIFDANDAFLSLLELRREDLPIAWRDITPLEMQARDEQAILEFERTGTALPYEKDFLTRSGERIPMLIGTAHLGDGQAIVIALDQSERKRAERFIAQQQTKLEETIAERTRELVESRTRLVEAEHLAAVGTLAAGVAHQINNPIGAILNSAEYAILCAEDEGAHETFRAALESNLAEARRCAQIVKSMLQFSRDEPTRKWNEDLNRVALRAHRAISAYAQDRSAKVTIHTPGETILCRISPIEIEQAIVNVLRNAIESRVRGASISVSLTQRDKFAEIEILDDGRGIDEQDRDRVFEPFYSTRTRAGGTGLGLSVAHGIIRDHGGEIRIQSIHDEGTRVTILLPIVE